MEYEVLLSFLIIKSLDVGSRIIGNEVFQGGNGYEEKRSRLGYSGRYGGDACFQWLR